VCESHPGPPVCDSQPCLTLVFVSDDITQAPLKWATDKLGYEMMTISLFFVRDSDVLQEVYQPFSPQVKINETSYSYYAFLKATNFVLQVSYKRFIVGLSND